MQNTNDEKEDGAVDKDPKDLLHTSHILDMRSDTETSSHSNEDDSSEMQNAKTDVPEKKKGISRMKELVQKKIRDDDVMVLERSTPSDDQVNSPTHKSQDEIDDDESVVLSNLDFHADGKKEEALSEPSSGLTIPGSSNAKEGTAKVPEEMANPLDADPKELLHSSKILDMRGTSVDDGQKKVSKPAKEEKLPTFKKKSFKKVVESKSSIEPKNAKILFFGTPEFSVPILEALIKNAYVVIGVVTQPDKKKNKEKELSPTPVKEVALKNSIEVYQPTRVDEEFIKQVQDISPDVIITAAYGKILPKELLSIPPFRSINVHPSLLPKYRGASPIQNAILENESTTGTTIMLMDEGMDTGDILGQKEMELSSHVLFVDLSDQLSKLSAQLLLEILPGWFEKKIPPTQQKDEDATHCQLIEKEDGKVFWNEPARSIYNKYRAFHDWPGIYSFWKNGQTLRRMKFIEIEFHENSEGEKNDKAFGEVYALGDQIAVRAENGSIILKTVQLEGKKALSMDDFLKGYPGFINSKLQ